MRHTDRIRWFTTLLLITALIGSATTYGNVIYVCASATGGNNGTSWVDAYADLQLALGAAHAGDQIWVAAGVYRPAVGSALPGVSFELPGNVALYGGFAGTELSLDQRDPLVNVTQLSGDLDATSVNSYHVLRASSATVNAVLDGFDVIDGFANGNAADRNGAGLLMSGGTLSIANCTFRNNQTYSGAHMAQQNGGDGGAIHGTGGSQITLTNCRFESNRTGDGSTAFVAESGGSGGNGGALFADAAFLSITGCAFEGNITGNGMSGGQNRGGGRGGDGGAIRARGGTVGLSDCTFRTNLTGSGGYSGSDFPTRNRGGYGGAVSLDSLTSPVSVLACLFESNRSGIGTNAGALYCIATPTTVVNSTFRSNSAGDGDPGGGTGGAIYCTTSNLSVISSRFESNRAGTAGAGRSPGSGGSGGAIAAVSGAVSLLACDFEGNAAGDGVPAGDPPIALCGSGGAVILGFGGSASPAPVEIQNCIFVDNRTGVPVTGYGFGGSGGAIQVVRASSAVIANSIFAGNQAGPAADPGTGGAIRLNANAILANLTIAGNSTASANGGGGLALFADATIRNCALWENTAAGGTLEQQQIFGFNAGDSIDYSCVQGLSGAFGGIGNTAADPLFRNLPGDYRLSAGSPCIDAADNAAVPAGLTLDVFGNPRFVDDPATSDTGVGAPPIVDMGAAEFGPCLADLDDDRDVDLADLAQILSQFGSAGPGLSADFDADGDVDLQDLAHFLSRFATSCP